MTDIMQAITRHFSETMNFGPEATGRILTKVRANLSVDLAALELCLESEDLDPVPARLHKLKGDFSNIGLTALADQVHDLEKAAGQKSGDELRDRIRVIRQTLSPLLNA